jgi:hypothetical protein
MPKFLIDHNGEKFEVEAPDETTALDAFADAMGLPNERVTAVPPAGLVPGSPDYAKWAVEQARSGRKLPAYGGQPAKRRADG